MFHRLVPAVGASLLLASCGGGSGSTPTPAPDTTAPNTTLAGAPVALTNSNSASISFTATETSTFEVRLDGGTFVAATSPLQLAGLAEGAHELRVRARDTFPRVDPTPAVATRRVDVTAPTVRVILPTPNSYTDASTMIVRGTTQDAVGVTGVEIAGVAATSADEFVTWAVVVPVASGTNILPVLARDSAGNTGTAPLPLTIVTGSRILICDISTRV